MSNNISWLLKTQCTKIFIENLRLLCSIGVYDHEHKRAQPLIINCEVWVRNESAISPHDNINDVLDYTKLLKTIEKETQSQHFELQETLINHLASSLVSFPSVVLLRLATAKPMAYEKADSVGLEIWREGVAFSLLKA